MDEREVILRLTDAEAQSIVNALIQSYPLLMKVSNQIREQTLTETDPSVKYKGTRLDGDGKEVRS